jgi:hypothetical protein
MMIRLIPKIFYARMEDGLELFVNCLNFTVLHHDETLAVIEREGAKARKHILWKTQSSQRKTGRRLL